MKYKEEATTLKESIHNSAGGNDQSKGTFLHIPFILELLLWNKKGHFKLINTISYVTSQYCRITPSTNVCLHSDAS